MWPTSVTRLKYYYVHISYIVIPRSVTHSNFLLPTLPPIFCHPFASFCQPSHWCGATQCTLSRPTLCERQSALLVGRHKVAHCFGKCLLLSSSLFSSDSVGMGKGRQVKTSGAPWSKFMLYWYPCPTGMSPVALLACSRFPFMPYWRPALVRT